MTLLARGEPRPGLLVVDALIPPVLLGFGFHFPNVPQPHAELCRLEWFQRGFYPGAGVTASDPLSAPRSSSASWRNTALWGTAPQTVAWFQFIKRYHYQKGRTRLKH